MEPQRLHIDVAKLGNETLSGVRRGQREQTAPVRVEQGELLRWASMNYSPVAGQASRLGHTSRTTFLLRRAQQAKARFSALRPPRYFVS